MATSPDYIPFFCEQIQGVGAARCRKMFGEYMVYIRVHHTAAQAAEKEMRQNGEI